MQTIEEMVEELKNNGVKPIGSEKVVNQTMDTSIIQYIDRLEDALKNQFSEEQRTIINSSGDACIIACAGSGKTTTSISLVAKRIMSGEVRDVNKLVMTTYSRSGATEMKDRLNHLLKLLGINKKVDVRTLHSLFLHILTSVEDANGKTRSKILKESEQLQIVREAIKAADYKIKDDDLMTIANLLSYQVNNLMSDDDLLKSYINPYKEDKDFESKYTLIRTNFSRIKKERNVIDYDDMQVLVYTWLVRWKNHQNEQLRKFSSDLIDYCQNIWNYYIIDEAQDISKIQFEIIKSLVLDKNTSKLKTGLVMIGDDDQCIYEWRGSDPSIILSSSAVFNIPTYVLSTNYRCKSEIVDYATRGVKCNKGRYNKSMQANTQGGKVEFACVANNDMCDLSENAKNKVVEWIANGEKADDIAILCRNNFHLAIVNNMLLREGIYCTSTEDMKMTKSFMYNDMKTLLDIVQNKVTTDEIRSITWKLVRFLGIAKSQEVASLQQSSALPYKSVIGYICKEILDVTNLDFNDKTNVPETVRRNLRRSFILNGESVSSMVALYRILQIEDEVERFECLVEQYINCCSFLYKSKDKQRSIYGIGKYFVKLIKEDGIAKTSDFLRVTEQLEKGTFAVSGPRVTLTTEHSAKGREWRNVIMFACDNITQPAFDGILVNLQNGIKKQDIFSEIDEERRLFYVGNTRAKENLYVLASRTPSIFVMESLGLVDNPSNDHIVDLAVNNNYESVYHQKFIDFLNRDDNNYSLKIQ